MKDNINIKDTLKIDGIRKKLDVAIDDMDMLQIEKQLTKLSDKELDHFSIEDSKLFAKRIIKKNKKGFDVMIKKYKKAGALVASVSLILMIGVSVCYATGFYKEFKFFNKNNTVEIRTNQNISKEEAKQLADEASEAYENQISEGATIAIPMKSFASIKEVKETLGIDIVLPSYIPTDFEMNSQIETQTYNDSYNIYTTFQSKDNEERLLGITVISDSLPEDSTEITVTDSVFRDTYTTPAGTEYTILEEDGGIIAMAEINNIQYALVFMGLSQEEMNKVINSVDLSKY